MSEEIAAKRYAKALFEIGVENKKLKVFEKELSSFNDLVLSGSLEFLSNPVFSTEEKKMVVEKVAKKEKTSNEFIRFLDIVVEEKRTGAIPEIYDYFKKCVNEHEGKENASVYSAVKMSVSQVDSLKKVLSKVRGKNIVIENIVDESLVGGLKVKIGSFIYDGSVKGFINKFRENI